MKIAIIAAQSENRVIGSDNDIPWHVRGDYQFFKKTTQNHALIAGRKTYISYPGSKALPNRHNIIVTRDTSYQLPDADVEHDLAAAIENAKKFAAENGQDEIFIGGGSEIYKLGMDLCDRIYLTQIHLTVDGDRYFPELSPDQWHKVSSEFHEAGAHDDADYTIEIWERR